MMEYNEITYNGDCIANHYYEEDGGWLIVFKKGLDVEKQEEYKKGIQKMADRNKLKVEFV